MRGTPWTEDEDALLAEWYPRHGGRWEGWKELLPMRTYDAIVFRASRIGVSYERPQRQPTDGELEAAEDAAIAVAALDERQRARLWYLVRHAGRERG